ncbi:MAG: hypothetical protein QNL33_01250 [Akkermansiaceae bacterium]|jgi:hypothetical protein
MTSSEKRLPAYVLIPWVCAVVAILGCNVLGPNALSLRKIKYLDGSSLTQVAPESPATGNAPNLPVFLAADPSDGFQLIDPSSRRLAVVSRNDLPAPSAHGGDQQGRAPPVEFC